MSLVKISSKIREMVMYPYKKLDVETLEYVLSIVQMRAHKYSRLSNRYFDKGVYERSSKYYEIYSILRDVEHNIEDLIYYVEEEEED